MKARLKKEGNELTTICSQLKMQSADRKFYKTDVANTRGILRIIQSVPSKKAEPFKMWLAQMGKERIDETADPEIAIDRAFQTYLKNGYSEKWINQRMLSSASGTTWGAAEKGGALWTAPPTESAHLPTTCPRHTVALQRKS